MKNVNQVLYVVAYMLLIALIPWAVFAQNTSGIVKVAATDEELSSELGQMYNEKSVREGKAASSAGATSVNVNVQAQPTLNTSQSTQQGVRQRSQSIQAQSQPTTVIESSPLVESKSDLMRRSRQEAEMNTEQRIVEKLESSRIDDEKRRADQLFGDRLKGASDNNSSQMHNQPPMTPPATVNSQQPQQTAPVVVPIVIEDSKSQREKELEGLRQEIRSSLKTAKEVEVVNDIRDKAYFGGFFGLGDYVNARNVRGVYSLGVNYGKYFQKNMVWESSFMYSNYEIEQVGDIYYYANNRWYPRITNMNQYTMAFALKYIFLLDGVIKPNIGGLISYSYRTYADRQFAITNNEANSHAFDMGLTSGVDFDIDNGISVGIEFRYMWNLYNRINNKGWQESFVYNILQGGRPVEETEYMNLLFNFKTKF